MNQGEDKRRYTKGRFIILNFGLIWRGSYKDVYTFYLF